jgi:hypothetical protein
MANKLNAIYNKIHNLKRIKHEDVKVYDFILNNVNLCFDFICENYTNNIGTKKYYIGLLNKILQETKHPLYFEINTKYKILCTEINEINYNNDENISKEKLDKLITWDKYKFYYYGNKNKLDLQDLFMISLYLLQPPRRIKDYYLLKLNSGPNRIYYNENNNMFIELNDYKTHKKYGVYKNIITGELKEIIDKYINEYVNEDGRFFNYSNSSSITNRIKRINEIICGKKLTVNDLRHMYISNFLRNNPSTHNKKELAKKMGHSITLQSMYNYRNLEDKK